MGVEITNSMAGKDYAEAIRRGTIKGVLTAAIQVEAQAKRIAAGFVISGRLKGSITHAMRGNASRPEPPATAMDGVSTPLDELTAHVGTNVAYAIYNEYGTVKKWGGNPFLRPAVDIVRGKLPVKESIQAAMQAEKNNYTANRKRFFEAQGIQL